ncbi:MAG TPA: adenylate/guanylate cyclase domain-containing protein [Trebonia sp.]
MGLDETTSDAWLRADRGIGVFLADDNLIVREGVRALIERNDDLRIVGVAADYDGVVDGCAATEPQVLVTDVRMPPSFRREGIDAAREVRSRFPGTGVVILSQYDDPEYAVSLLSSGSSGYGYLLKDRVAEGTQLADAIRSVATGGTALDPSIVEALVRPVVAPGGLAPAEAELLELIAEGRTIKAIAALRGVSPSAVDTEVEAVFVKLATGVSAGDHTALNRLRQLHQAIVDGKEQGETLSRLLPSGLAEKLRGTELRIGETERVTVTVLMSDIRSYSTIAEKADPSALAGQLNTHRAAMNKAILGEDGTVMQFVGDAVMAVFGAPFPQPDHADRAVAAAAGMHALQAEINAEWQRTGLPEFGLGIGLSTGPAAAALLGSAERLEYTLVGDTVNLSQRLQGLAAAGETVISSGTKDALSVPVPLTALPAQLVKGRQTPVTAFRADPPGGASPAAAAAPPGPAAGGTQSTEAPPRDTQDETAVSPAAATGPETAQEPQPTQGIRTWKIWKVLRQNESR